MLIVVVQYEQNALANKTGQRTVPSIWIGGKFIGGSSRSLSLPSFAGLTPQVTRTGCSDLEAKQRSGELKTLLGGKAK